MTGPTGPEGQPEPFRGTEYPSLEDSAGQPPDPNAPVEYPADPGLPPPIYPAPYPGRPRLSRRAGLSACARLLPRCRL